MGSRRRSRNVARFRFPPQSTIRQQQLVSLVARGLTNGIASELNLSEFTVKNHLHRIRSRSTPKAATSAWNWLAPTAI
jgi:DNA-binding NarL/FixJ family response regulator